MIPEVTVYMLVILREKCSACGLCADVCPTGAIPQIGPYRIDVAKCSECGECKESCPADAIVEKQNDNR